MLVNLFTTVLNMSFTASYVILFVLLVRLLLKKAPKVFSYALWGVVLFRLVSPVSFYSWLSLMPTAEPPIPQDIVYATLPQIDTGVAVVDGLINPLLPAATPYASINPMQSLLVLGGIVWLIGCAAMLAHSGVSLVKLKRRLQGATPMGNNVFLCEGPDTAFVLGILRPKIYLPAGLTAAQQQHILLHEQTHIRRLDHIAKAASFFALCLHWFNPLVWLAFLCSGKDMEMACDEAVIKTLGNDVKKEYSTSLLRLATGKRIVGGTPLAFGEGDTKGRIKNVLNYKKPAFWVTMLAAVALVAAAIALVPNPVRNKPLSNAEALWQHRTPYVGNNAAVGGILSALDFPDEFAYDGFSLETAEPPHGITVNLKATAPDAASQNAAALQYNAIIMFSLVENVDTISFALDNGITAEFTRKLAQQLLGKENLFAYTETLEGLSNLLSRKPQTADPGIADTLEQKELLAQLYAGNIETLSFWVKPDESLDVLSEIAAGLYTSRLNEQGPLVCTLMGVEAAPRSSENETGEYLVTVSYSVSGFGNDDASAAGADVSEPLLTSVTETLLITPAEGGNYDVTVFKN